MNEKPFYPKALPDKIILVVLIFWAIIPQLERNIFGVLPPFMFLCILITFSIYLTNNINDSIFPFGFRYFFLFACAILVSQINAITGTQYLFSAFGNFLLWISVPYLGVWLCRINSESIIFWSVGIILFFYNIYNLIYFDFNLDKTIGPISIFRNDIGFTIAMSVPILLGYLRKKISRLKIVAIFTIISITLSLYLLIFYIGTRSAILCVLFSIIIFTISYFKNQNKRLIFLAFTIIVLVSIFSLSSIIANLDSSLLKKYEKSFSIADNAGIAVRVSFGLKALELIKDYPVFGGGWHNFRFYTKNQFVSINAGDGTRLVGIDFKNPHSNFIRLMGETGLFGTISYFLLISFIAINIWRLRYSNTQIFNDMMMFWLAIPAYHFFSIFHDAFNNYGILLFSFSYAIMHKEKLLSSNIQNRHQ